MTLHEFYPDLNLYVHVRTLTDQNELVAKGVKHAGTGYIESTLARCGMLLKDLGVSEQDVSEVVSMLRDDDYALIRTHTSAHKRGQVLSFATHTSGVRSCLLPHTQAVSGLVFCHEPAKARAWLARSESNFPALCTT